VEARNGLQSAQFGDFSDVIMDIQVGHSSSGQMKNDIQWGTD